MIMCYRHKFASSYIHEGRLNDRNTPLFNATQFNTTTNQASKTNAQFNQHKLNSRTLTKEDLLQDCWIRLTQFELRQTKKQTKHILTSCSASLKPLSIINNSV